MEFKTKEKHLAAWNEDGQLVYLGKAGDLVDFPELRSGQKLIDSILMHEEDHGIFIFDTFVTGDEVEEESATFPCEVGIAKGFPMQCPIYCLYNLAEQRVIEVPDRMSNPMSYELMGQCCGKHIANGASREDMIIVKIKHMTRLCDSSYTLGNVMGMKNFVHAIVRDEPVSLAYVYPYLDPARLQEYAEEYNEVGFVVMDDVGSYTHQRKVYVFNLIFKGNQIQTRSGGNLLADKGKVPGDHGTLVNPIYVKESRRLDEESGLGYLWEEGEEEDE